MVLKLVKEGKLRPVIEEILPLKDVKAGHDLIASRKFFGKVVLEV